ncbi:unnamed protein product [Laminaria digitata]
MKKRAIHTAASYDEFRHMVSCAQLTPVTRKEMEMLSDQKRGSSGRRKGSSTKTRNRAAGAIGGSAKKAPLRAPQDHSQFRQDWRRRCHTDSERRAYLRLIGPEKLQVIFRVEMEPDVLGQVLSLVSSREETARICVDWLWALTRTGRFEINIQFLDGAEKRALALVFDLIAEVFGDSRYGHDPERLDSLRKVYAA